MAYIHQKTAAGSMDGFIQLPTELPIDFMRSITWVVNGDHLGGGYYSIQCSDGRTRLSHREGTRFYIYVDGLKKMIPRAMTLSRHTGCA